MPQSDLNAGQWLARCRNAGLHSSSRLPFARLALCVAACASLGLSVTALAQESALVAAASPALPAEAPLASAPTEVAIARVAAIPAAAPAALPDSPEQSKTIVDHLVEMPKAALVRAKSAGLLAMHSDLKFSVLSAPREAVDPAIAATLFQEQVKRISAGLQDAALKQYPEAVAKIGAFDVYIAAADDLNAMSSGSGKIAVNAGFARLNPTDDWLAFVIAREMGHVVAGHHDSNSGASLFVSVVMNLIIPGSGLLKTALSFAGSQAASESGREKQIKEADAVAMNLLEGAGYTAKSVALNLKLNPISEADAKTSWAAAFRVSALSLSGPQGGAAEVPATAVAQAPAVKESGVQDQVEPAQQPQVVAVQAVQPQAVPIQSVQPQAVPVQVVQPRIVPALQEQSESLPVVATPARWQPEELVMRSRPSGMPGPLLLGGYAVPVRHVE